jgi:hypothetical protein
MADQPPISTEVPETVTVDTGADSKTLGDLNSEFKDFWAEQDASTEGAPAAPAAPGTETTGPAQETRETEKPKPETKPAAAQTPKPEPSETPPARKEKELTDDEIDRMSLPPGARPELVQNFQDVKEMWKKDRAQLKAEAAAKAKLESDLLEARKTAWTPEQKADYEHAASIRRRFDFVSDPEFIQRFHTPIRGQFEKILGEAISALPERQSAEAWANHIHQNYNPDQLSRDWWLKSVIDKVPNELDRASLLQSVTELLKMQKSRDEEISRRTQDKSAFDNWIQEKTNFTAQRVQEEIMNEIGEQEKRIQEVLPRDPESAKTTEERAAIAAHNERFQKLNGFFVETMKDLSAKGPRAWVRAAVEATRAQLLDGEYKKLEEEVKGLRAERDQYKAELDKIAGARRRISHTSGTPPTPSGTKASGANGGLSIRDLDIRKSFDNYDWGDESK